MDPNRPSFDMRRFVMGFHRERLSLEFTLSCSVGKFDALLIFAARFLTSFPIRET